MRRIRWFMLLGIIALVIFSRTISAETQAAAYQSDSQTRLLFHLDEKNGYKVTDTSSYGNNGSMGSGKWNESGKFGGCLYLDGSWDAVRCDTDGSLNPTDQITFECWVKPEDTTGIRQVISKDIIGPMWYDYHIEIRNGKIICGISTTGGYFEVTSPNDIELNTWTHLAGEYDGSALRLYVNGNEVIQKPAKGTLINSNKRLNLGAWSNDYWYKGFIDEVRISSVARFSTVGGKK